MGEASKNLQLLKRQCIYQHNGNYRLKNFKHPPDLSFKIKQKQTLAIPSVMMTMYRGTFLLLPASSPLS